MLIHERIVRPDSWCLLRGLSYTRVWVLERVYQNAMFFELQGKGLDVAAQRRCPVFYKNREVGEYFSDIIVNDVVILELKACDKIAGEHVSQLQNYLKASDIELGFILNFGPRPQFFRKVFTNSKKLLK